MKDYVVESVIEKYASRSKSGIKKYKKTLDRDDLTLPDWLEHLQDELMDATLYVQKLKEEYERLNGYVPIETWANAEKITHEGHIYVKISDLFHVK